MESLTNSYSYASYERDQERKIVPSDKTFRDNISSWSDASSNTAADMTGMSKESDHGEQRVISEPSRSRVVVTMVACLFLHMSAFGMFVALGVVYVELIAYFETPRSKAALVQSVYNGFSLGGGLIFTKIITTYDTGLVIAVPSLVATVSFVASAFAPNIEVVIVLVGAVAGLAVSNGVLGAFVVTSWMFQKNRRLALAFLTIGTTVGQIILPFVTRALIDEYLWQGAVIILGSVLYLNCIPCGLIIHLAKAYFRKGETNNAKYNKPVDTNCLTNSAFILFLISFVVLMATASVEQWFVVDLTINKGFSADAGATLLSLNGIFGFTGRCLGTLILKLAPTTKQEIHLAYGISTWGIGHIIVSLSTAYWGLVLGIIVRGLSAGLVVSFLPGLQVDLRGLEKYTQTTAITSCIGGISTILGGFLGGLSFDITGSYDLIFFIATGATAFDAVVMIVVFFILKRRRQHQDYERI